MEAWQIIGVLAPIQLAVIGAVWVIVQHSMKGFMAQVDARFAQVDARFTQIDARFAQVDAQLTDLSQRLGSLTVEVIRLAAAKPHPGRRHTRL